MTATELFWDPAISYLIPSYPPPWELERMTISGLAACVEFADAYVDALQKGARPSR